ncbi:MAG TPA: tripartite tricarboxylate transporter substrate binding protein [Pseudolabrys sp.]
MSKRLDDSASATTLGRLSRRALLRCAGGLGALAAMPSVSLADDQYPTRNVNLVVPFPPGGSPDILSRLLGRKLSERFDKPFIIENRGGAGGSIAAEYVARSSSDGYTLMMGHIGTLAVNVSIYPKLAYDPLRSFVPVSAVATVNNMLVVNPSLPVNSVAELIDYARKNPRKLNFSSGGNGSAAHIAITAFADAAKIVLVHVPYRGTAPSVIDLIAGQVQLTMTGTPAVIGQVHAGKLRALGVAGLKRLESEPNIPTIAETLPGFEANQWYGVVAPAGTPDPIVRRLNEGIRTAMAAPDVADVLWRDGAQVWVSSPEEFRAYIGKEITRWADLVQRANIHLD